MSTLGRRTPGPSDTAQRSKKSESFVDKLTGTLTRKKKTPAPHDEPHGQHGAQPPRHEDEENEADEVELEGRDCLDSALVPQSAKDIVVEEGEQRRFITRDSSEDPKVREIIHLLTYWLNDEMADQRIVIRRLDEDLYDGQVIQRLIEKLADVRIEVPEVSQSEEGQRQKLQIVIATVNRILLQGQHEQPRWTADLIHSKDLTAIMQLLIAIALFYRAPIRLPEYASMNLIIASKSHGHLRTENVTEQLTTKQDELGPKGERDAFDTLCDYGPDKLAHVKTSLLAFCNKHLNKINLEVNDIDTQFQDGVFLVLLMGLLEGYFVPLYHFKLQVASHDEKVKNVSFAFKLMEDAGLAKPRCRAADIANGDLKSTLRLLHLLFTKYKHV